MVSWTTWEAPVNASAIDGSESRVAHVTAVKRTNARVDGGLDLRHLRLAMIKQRRNR